MVIRLTRNMLRALVEGGQSGFVEGGLLVRGCA